MTTIARLVDACPAFAEAMIAHDLASLHGDESAMAVAWERCSTAAAAFRQGASYLCRIQESNLRTLLGDNDDFSSLLETLRCVTGSMTSALSAERSNNPEVERSSSAANES